MVEIIKRTDEERELEKKVKRLSDFTSKVIKKCKVINDVGGDHILVNNNIHVHCDRNLINIYSEEYFNTALQLAEAYETETGEKWKLKTVYD